MSRLTSGERRGLAALLALLAIFTVIAFMRTHVVETATEALPLPQQEAPSAVAPSDTTRSIAVKAPEKSKRPGRKRAANDKKKKTTPPPEPRSILDEKNN